MNSVSVASIVQINRLLVASLIKYIEFKLLVAVVTNLLSKKKLKLWSTLCYRLDFAAMRKRDIQSFTLRLADLKEYEAIRTERNNAKLRNHVFNVDKASTAAGGTASESANSSSTDLVTPKLVKYGPKNAQDIRERIGLNFE